MSSSDVVIKPFRDRSAARLAEPWPDEVDVRDSYGYLWKTIPKTKARQLVESGVAEAVGRGSVKYVRLRCSLNSNRNDANRTTERVRNDAGVIIAPRNVVKHVERRSDARN